MESVKAIRFFQGVGTGKGQEMYLLAVPVEWLIRRTKVDVWNPQIEDDDWEHQGYQRSLSDSHLRAIGRYLRGTLKTAQPVSQLPIFPTSVLLAVRRDVEFKAFEKREKDIAPRAQEGDLRLPDDEPLWIIDGQHRLKGLEQFIIAGGTGVDQFNHYHLPVTLMVCKDKIQEMAHFLLINKEAKSVRTDLAERLLDQILAREPDLIRDDRLRTQADKMAEALAIVKFLLKEPNQPWSGRIAKANEPRTGEKVASQGQLTKSLRHITANRPLNWSDEKLHRFVADFWIALTEILPQAFSDPTRYTIQRAVGFGALHRLLPNLAPMYKDADSIVELLKGVDPYFTDPEYWERGGPAAEYSSEGGYATHADMIRDALKDKLSV